MKGRTEICAARGKIKIDNMAKRLVRPRRPRMRSPEMQSQCMACCPGGGVRSSQSWRASCSQLANSILELANDMAPNRKRSYPKEEIVIRLRDYLTMLNPTATTTPMTTGSFSHGQMPTGAACAAGSLSFQRLRVESQKQSAATRFRLRVAANARSTDSLPPRRSERKPVSSGPSARVRRGR